MADLFGLSSIYRIYDEWYKRPALIYVPPVRSFLGLTSAKSARKLAQEVAATGRKARVDVEAVRVCCREEQATIREQKHQAQLRTDNASRLLNVLLDSEQCLDVLDAWSKVTAARHVDREDDDGTFMLTTPNLTNEATVEFQSDGHVYRAKFERTRNGYGVVSYFEHVGPVEKEEDE